MFLEEGKAYTGIIIWVGAACEMEEGTTLPMRYIIQADQQTVYPCIVSPGNIIERGRSVS
jgi:hypothetical protein